LGEDWNDGMMERWNIGTLPAVPGPLRWQAGLELPYFLIEFTLFFNGLTSGKLTTEAGDDFRKALKTLLSKESVSNRTILSRL
jgi:hypothetical protein